MAIASTNDITFAKAYEIITGSALNNFKEDAEALRGMQTSDRKLETQLWVRLMNQITRMRDSQYDFQSPENRYYANVAPPFNASNPPAVVYDSGIAPASIKEQDTRKAYEEALRENHEKALRALFEFRLKNLSRDCTSSAVTYFISSYAKTPADAKELITAMDGISDEKQKAEIKARLADYVQLTLPR